MLFNYDELGWGLGIKLKGDAFLKELSDAETEEYYAFDVIHEDFEFDFGDDEPEERDDYNLLFLSPHITESQWGTEDENYQQKLKQLQREIKELKSEIKPGHKLWNYRGGQFLDMFLVEEVKELHGTKYDSVLLMEPDPEHNFPVATIWELVPEEKRDILINLQRSGIKIFGAFSETFRYTQRGFLCLEIYVRPD